MQPLPYSRIDQASLNDVAPYWNDGCPFKSRLVDVVSASIPGTERLIIDVVRAVTRNSDNDILRAHGQLLIRHEATHIMIHAQLNERLRAQGLPIDELEAFVKEEVARVMRYRNPKWRLGYVMALEYLGFMVSTCLVSNRVDTIRFAHPTMRQLYLEHAQDEVDHAHVVPSIAHSSRLSYLTRVLPMIHVTCKSVVTAILFTNRMLVRDGIAPGRRRRLLLNGWWWLWMGTILPLLPAYFRFYAPVHPPPA